MSQAPAYKSFGEQSLHYFTRAQEGPPPGPVGGAAAWHGADLRKSDAWRERLSAVQVDEMQAALRHAVATGREARDLRAEDLPLPGLHADFARWRQELSDGRGFLLLSGVPVERWPQAEAELFYWGFGLHLGSPGAQNPQGDLLGHVHDTGEDASDPFVRLYRTHAEIAFHCDAADVVGLLCLRTARRGGASRIVSSVSVHDEVWRRRPDLARRLYEPFLLDVRDAGSLNHFPVPPCCFAGGRLRTFWHSDYFRSAQRHDDVPPFTEQERELLDLYEQIASDPEFHLDMELAPGDMQLLSNHTVAHARTAYEDDPRPGHGRHLLRLWLSLD